MLYFLTWRRRLKLSFAKNMGKTDHTTLTTVCTSHYSYAHSSPTLQITGKANKWGGPSHICSRGIQSQYPFKIHLHKHFGRKVTRKYIFQRKQKNPISQRKRPFASKRTIINDSRPTPHQKPFVEVSRTSLAILFFASILSKILWASRSPLSLETYKKNYVDTKEKE